MLEAIKEVDDYEHDATTDAWWRRVRRATDYFNQLGIGEMVSEVVWDSGDAAELPVVKTVVFVRFARTGALVPLAAIFAITPPRRPWWLDAEYWSGVIAGSESFAVSSVFTKPARVTLRPSAFSVSANATA